MSSSEFLLNRHPPGKKADLSRLKLLELLALIVNDADTAQIEDIFKQQPKLAYSLMRLVNSAANAPRAPITCFSQAINLLGRRQLQRWLQLLVFADQNTGQHANPLLQKAATRGRLIELLADNPEDDASKQLLDTAFMVGTFSLLDVLLNMPLKEILQHLPLPAAAHAALADHSGLLGQILKAVSASESRDLSGARQQLQHLAITPEKHLTAQLSAFSWATKIHPPA
jgi:EAL and modified HD-GYP domain-containing signal transduction protein